MARTIAPVRRRRGNPVQLGTALVVATFMAVAGGLGLAASTATPSGAQDATSTTSGCPEPAEPKVQFIGTVVSISGDTVTFDVQEEQAGSVGADTIAVRYPNEYNARKLKAGHSYVVPLVDATTGRPAGIRRPVSFVDTAELGSCGAPSTRNLDGSKIPTGTLSGVKSRFPVYAGMFAVVVLGLLVVLVLLGRFFDRRSRYRSS